MVSQQPSLPPPAVLCSFLSHLTFRYLRCFLPYILCVFVQMLLFVSISIYFYMYECYIALILAYLPLLILPKEQDDLLYDQHPRFIISIKQMRCGRTSTTDEWNGDHFYNADVAAVHLVIGYERRASAINEYLRSSLSLGLRLGISQRAAAVAGALTHKQKNLYSSVKCASVVNVQDE